MKQFKQAIELIKSEKKLITVVASIFVLMFIVGLMFPYFIQSIQDQIVKQIVERFSDKNIFQVFFMILSQNSFATLLTLLLGITLIVPLFSLCFNAYFVGAITMQKTQEIGMEAFIRLIPHGIFEIPAFLLAISFGLRLMLGLFKGKKLGQLYKDALKVYVFVILPLLIVAALIETLAIGFVGSSLKAIA